MPKRLALFASNASLVPCYHRRATAGMGSVEISSRTLAWIALLCGIWLALAVWATIRAARRSKSVTVSQADISRSRALLENSPAMPLLVGVDGSIEAPPRLEQVLGLPSRPARLEELSAHGNGLASDDLEALTDCIRNCVSTAARFSTMARAQGSRAPWKGGPGRPQRSGSHRCVILI